MQCQWEFVGLSDVPVGVESFICDEVVNVTTRRVWFAASSFFSVGTCLLTEIIDRSRDFFGQASKKLCLLSVAL